jgi:hypothetical protein
MRYLKTFGLVILTTALWGASCAAQSAPSGSYQQSCRNVGMEGSTLYASCRSINGQWQSASLPDFQRCAGDIGNDNGTLRCDMRRNEYQPAPQANWQNGVPGGSYAQTCRDIRTNGNTLEATCDTGSGDWTRTALQDINQCKPETIQNIHGRLECTKADYNQGYGQGTGQGYGQGDRRDNGQGYGQGDRRDNGQGYGQGDRRDYGASEVPDGDYMQSCRNVRVSGSTLLATCRQRNGRWRQASLRYFNQCTSDITNYNGRLACSR